MPLRDVLGHRTTLNLLSRALGAGTLPPSLILAGPDGVGKRQTAVALAQVLNCLEPVRPAPWPATEGIAPLSVDACGNCGACRRIARGVHPDVLVIEPGETGAIKVDAVREVVREVGFKPFEGKRRVVIFDTADALLVDSQDALLKTLEEPPPGSVLVLVTSQPGSLLPTVRSRCPIVRFGPLSVVDVTAWLMRVDGLGEAEARAVAGVARGSLSAAREVASETAGAEGYRAAARRVLEQVAHTTDARERLSATSEIVGKSKGKGSGASERDSLSHHLQAMAALIRDVGLLSTRADVADVVNADLLPALEALAPAFSPDRTLRAFAAVGRAIAALERNASPKTVADWVVLQL
jgi:DNA polymerase III subunit delta'